MNKIKIGNERESRKQRQMGKRKEQESYGTTPNGAHTAQRTLLQPARAQVEMVCTSLEECYMGMHTEELWEKGDWLLNIL